MTAIPRILCMLLFCLGPLQAFAGTEPAETRAGEAAVAGEAPPPPEAEEISLPFTWQEAYKKSEREKTYSKGPDVHRSPSHCRFCHGEGEATAKNLLFEGRDVPLCRSCHPRAVYNLHVVGVEAKKAKVPETFPMPEGKITCVTCHDEPSCNPKGSPSWERPFFLRGTRSGFQFCFACHPPEGYEAYNPHDPKHLQSPVDRKDNCLFCHTDEIPADARRGLAFAALKGGPNDICAACHLPEPHFGIPAHLEATDEKMLERVEKAAGELGPWLPLGQGGVPLCVSCHDPHMPGLIPQKKQGPDAWIEAKGEEGSALRREYRKERLYPFVREQVKKLESDYGRELIIREPGLFHMERKKLLRAGMQEKGSMCLRCHDVFEGFPEEDKERRLDYRVLH